ncbi:MAG TPA: hypothetical protein V6D03_13480, partial [Candidatus Caenarcaniphilales bacterium]
MLKSYPMAYLDPTLVYPHTPKVAQVDDYHGMKVEDPYRWLEDPNSEAASKWIEAQNQITFSYLTEIPVRDRIKQRLTQLWDYQKYSVPFKQGNRYFFFKNDGLQNQSVLYTLTSLEDEPQVLLDPNTLSEDGTIALSGLAVSEDGQLIAYGLSTAGSDWQEWKVRRVATAEDLMDRLQWIKFSGAGWTHNSQGFFYSRYDEPNEATKLEDTNYFQKLFYHRLGTPQAEDVLVYERPDHKEWGFDGSVTEDGRYLIISVWQGSDRKNLVFFQDLEDQDAPVVELINQFEADYSFIGNEGPVFWFRTDLNAPRGRIIALNTANRTVQEVIPQAAETLDDASFLNNQFVVSYLKDAYTQIQIFDLSGELIRTVPLPGIGSVSGFSGKRDDTETFYSFTSFTSPTTIYRYDLLTGESTVFRQPEVDFNPDDYQTQQVFYHSKDGTRVPMFITHKKGLELNGENPTYLYGYGGFNISLTPSFSVSNLVWMELGGIYAVPNLRGGGEYG